MTLHDNGDGTGTIDGTPSPVANGQSFPVTIGATVRHTVRRHGRKKTSTTRSTIATVRYDLPSGASRTLPVTLSPGGYRMLESARGHRLTVAATTRATSGTAPHGRLTLTGPKPQRKAAPRGR